MSQVGHFSREAMDLVYHCGTVLRGNLVPELLHAAAGGIRPPWPRRRRSIVPDGHRARADVEMDSPRPAEPDPSGAELTRESLITPSGRDVHGVALEVPGVRRAAYRPVGGHRSVPRDDPQRLPANAPQKLQDHQ